MTPPSTLTPETLVELITHWQRAMADAGADTVTEESIIRPSCLGLKPSPYPVYISILFVFISNSINIMLVSESVIYNKVCYQIFENLTLCSNTTFSRSHPLLQVWAIYLLTENHHSNADQQPTDCKAWSMYLVAKIVRNLWPE